eukprot:scaffold10109_cov42-Cyclotella_meneghiniana.AAC.1
MPTNNSDLNALRNWITYKYVDKIWFQEDVDGSAKVKESVVEAPNEVQTAPPGRRKIIQDQPQQQQQSQENDLFGGGWDAFDSSNAPAAVTPAFQADFGSAPVSSNAFQADFGSQQQPTMVNMPPTQQQPFEANFDQAQQNLQPQQPVQSSFEANFASFDQGGAPHVQNQQQHAQPSFQANFGAPSSQPQPSFQANFDPSPQSQQPQQQSMFHANFDQVTQPAPSQTQQQNMFNANFGQMQQTNVQTQQQPNPPRDSQQENTTFDAKFDQSPMQASQQNNSNVMMNQGTNGFGNFDQTNQNNQIQMQQSHLQPMTQSNVMMSQGTNNYGDFSANNLQQNNNMNMQHPNIMNMNQGMNHFGKMDQSSVGANQNNLKEVQSDNVATMNQGMNNFGNFDQGFNTNSQQEASHQHLQQQGVANANTPQMSVNSMQGPVTKDLQGSTGSYNESSQEVTDQILTSSEGNQQSTINSNAFRSVDDERKSAFDAFDGLSLEPTPNAMESTGEVESTTTPSYMTSPPMPNPSLGNTNAGDDQTKSIKLQETAMMLKNLSLEQLLQVQHYIVSLESSDGSAPSGVESSVHMNMNDTMGDIQTQQNISERDTMGFNQTTVQQFQHTPELSQMQSLGPSSNIQSNLNGKSTSNFEVAMSNGSTMHSNKQQMGFNMQSSMNGAPNSGHNPTIAKEGAMNINSHHQYQQPLSNGMGQMHGVTPDPTVVSAPTLPPVEKEGNPFDMY